MPPPVSADRTVYVPAPDPRPARAAPESGRAEAGPTGPTPSGSSRLARDHVESAPVAPFGEASSPLGARPGLARLSPTSSGALVTDDQAAALARVARSERYGAAVSEFRARVRARALERVDAHAAHAQRALDQVRAGEDVARLAPAIQRARALMEQHAVFLRAARSNAGEPAAARDYGRAAELDAKARAALAELKALYREHPALGVLDLTDFSADHPTAPGDIRAALDAGYTELLEELGGVRARIASGDIPVEKLGRLVEEVKAELGVTRDAGTEEARFILEHFERVDTTEQLITYGSLVVGVALGIGAFLLSGGTAALLGAVGAAVNVGAAAYELELADDLHDVGRAARHEPEAAMVDPQGAAARYRMAVLNMGLAGLDAGLSARAVQTARVLAASSRLGPEMAGLSPAQRVLLDSAVGRPARAPAVLDELSPTLEPQTFAAARTHLQDLERIYRKIGASPRAIREIHAEIGLDRLKSLSERFSGAEILSMRRELGLRGFAELAELGGRGFAELRRHVSVETLSALLAHTDAPSVARIVGRHRAEVEAWVRRLGPKGAIPLLEELGPKSLRALSALDDAARSGLRARWPAARLDRLLTGHDPAAVAQRVGELGDDAARLERVLSIDPHILRQLRAVPATRLADFAGAGVDVGRVFREHGSARVAALLGQHDPVKLARGLEALSGAASEVFPRMSPTDVAAALDAITGVAQPLARKFRTLAPAAQRALLQHGFLQSLDARGVTQLARMAREDLDALAPLAAMATKAKVHVGPRLAAVVNELSDLTAGGLTSGQVTEHLRRLTRLSQNERVKSAAEWVVDMSGKTAAQGDMARSANELIAIERTAGELRPGQWVEIGGDVGTTVKTFDIRVKDASGRTVRSIDVITPDAGSAGPQWRGAPDFVSKHAVHGAKKASGAAGYGRAETAAFIEPPSGRVTHGEGLNATIREFDAAKDGSYMYYVPGTAHRHPRHILDDIMEELNETVQRSTSPSARLHRVDIYDRASGRHLGAVEKVGGEWRRGL